MKVTLPFGLSWPDLLALAGVAITAWKVWQANRVINERNERLGRELRLEIERLEHSSDKDDADAAGALSGAVVSLLTPLRARLDEQGQRIEVLEATNRQQRQEIRTLREIVDGQEAEIADQRQKLAIRDRELENMAVHINQLVEGVAILIDQLTEAGMTPKWHLPKHLQQGNHGTV